MTKDIEEILAAEEEGRPLSPTEEQMLEEYIDGVEQ